MSKDVESNEVVTPSKAVGRVTSLSEFIAKVKETSQKTSDLITFRGEASAEWKFKPGIFRAGNEKLLAHEKDAVREIVSIHPDLFDPDRTMFDRLVRMQHFGLPTRLMDVTGNPLVALFNASDYCSNASGEKDGRVYIIAVPNERHKYYDSDTVSCVSNLANLAATEKASLVESSEISLKRFNDPEEVPASDRLLQFIRSEKPSFRALIRSGELSLAWYVVPKMSNRRILAQNGAFILFGLKDKLTKGPEQIALRAYQAIIPAESKKEIRKDLAMLGITESTLFPEMDKAARHITSRYM